jgi:hypothetical protein
MSLFVTFVYFVAFVRNPSFVSERLSKLYLTKSTKSPATKAHTMAEAI